MEDDSAFRKRKKPVPFNFVLDLLEDLEPHTKPMFGCTAIYIGPKIVLITREKNDYLNDNGVWIATTLEHHKSLKAALPSMRSIGVFGPGPTGWQIIPAGSPDFEKEVTTACELIIDGDKRIGKIPTKNKSKKRSKK